ncbi:hypothetical protein V3C99_018146 [Haemonchus contortus]|uniref:Endonuclease-reverse transcriptase n=1 Tax=Haemonchus contortus TaxID=6289 RepID=A0A7I4Z3I3_HAECO
MSRVLREHLDSRICSSRHPLRPASIRSCPEDNCEGNNYGYEEDEIRQSKLAAPLLSRQAGPDDLATDLWKLKCWNLAGRLTDLFNQFVAGKKVPESWQQSTTIPTWKKKGSPGDCACYRPIRLLSHSMKIFERIVDSRIRDIVELTTNQCVWLQHH